MTGWREKRREARWKRKARMRNLEKINKNKKCLAAKIIWICSRLPWRRELKYHASVIHDRDAPSPSVKAWVEIIYGRFSDKSQKRRLPWRRELKLTETPNWSPLTKSPSVKAWVEIMCQLSWPRGWKSPSVKAWVENTSI